MAHLERGNVCSRANYRGFTRIEIIVVVAIVLIFVGLFLSMGGRHSDPNRRSTRVTLKVLDAIMQDYLKTHPEPLPPTSWPAAYTTSNNPAYDNLTISFSNPTGTNVPGSDITNWVACLMADKEASSKLASFPRGKDISDVPNDVILDAWGVPIRFVHSGWNGSSATVLGGRWYFMSAGPDGRFSQSIDNTSHAWPVDEIFSTDP
jgi:type II secretory pathway pseudopilin PulG